MQDYFKKLVCELDDFHALWALSTTGKLLTPISVCMSPVLFSEFLNHIFKFSSTFSHVSTNETI